MERKASFVRVSWLLLVVALGTALSTQAAGPFQYFTVTPCRLFDTRDTAQPFSGVGGQTRTYQVQGKCEVPNLAQAVAANVTAVTPTGLGHATLYPNGLATAPVVSTLNFAAGDSAVANGAIIPLGSTATFPNADLKVFAHASGGTVHLIIDIVGYFR